jgi:hypothetical protein
VVIHGSIDPGLHPAELHVALHLHNTYLLRILAASGAKLMGCIVTSGFMSWVKQEAAEPRRAAFESLQT